MYNYLIPGRVIHDDFKSYKDIESILSDNRVKSYKSLDSGIAVRKGGLWQYYFMAFDGKYHWTGSTRKLERKA